MTFRDKRTNEVVGADTYSKVFAFSHNSYYELVEEDKEEKTKASSKAKTKEEKTKTVDKVE